MQLRDYQQAAVEAVMGWFGSGKNNPLVCAPTGSGKSVILAELCRQAMQYDGTRVLIVTHVKELIAQNHAALLRMWPEAPTGIYSAGLGRKQMGRPITVAGVQSIARQAHKIGHVDLVIVDEAHLIPRSSDTLYGKLFAALRDANPHVQTIGLTATPYRLDSGMLHKGKDALFDGIAYDIPIARLVREGYLSPLVSKKPGMVLDTKGLRTRMGDWVEKDMAERFANEDVTQQAVAEIVELGRDRRSWIVFCVSVDHAALVAACIQSYGIAAASVTGKTPGPERDRLLQRFKGGELRALTSVGVLTTGFDAPGTDLIAFLRPTQSTGLYVQMIGRGMRTAPGKNDCLVLDFAGNVMRHGPVDGLAMPHEKAEGDGEGELGEAPTRACPQCASILWISARECPDCGFQFPEPEVKHEATACTEAVMNLTAMDNWKPVLDFAVERHTKPDAPDSLRLEYLVKGDGVVREWLCFEHGGYARQKAVHWWERTVGTSPPDSVTEALDRQSEIPEPVEVVTIKDGKWRRISRVRWGSAEAAA